VNSRRKIPELDFRQDSHPFQQDTQLEFKTKCHNQQLQKSPHLTRQRRVLAHQHLPTNWRRSNRQRQLPLRAPPQT
jgi:hypothetical protein